MANLLLSKRRCIDWPIKVLEEISYFSLIMNKQCFQWILAIRATKFISMFISSPECIGQKPAERYLNRHNSLRNLQSGRRSREIPSRQNYLLPISVLKVYIYLNLIIFIFLYQYSYFLLCFWYYFAFISAHTMLYDVMFLKIIMILFYK